MNTIFEAMESLENLCKTTNSLRYDEFICSVCMMFDEYHRVNPNSPEPPVMAAFVANMVKQVNEEKGAY